MAYALLTHTEKDAAASSITTSAIDTTGATLIVMNLSMTQTTFTLTDTGSNRWFQCSPVSAQGAQVNALLVCFNPTTNASHTFTLSAGSFPAMCVACFSGTLGALVATTAGGVTATTLTFPSITPSANGALWLAGMCGPNPDSLSIDSGFTLIENGGGSLGQKTGLAYLVQGTAGALTPTWTLGASRSFSGTLFAVLLGGAAGGSSVGHAGTVVGQGVRRSTLY